MDQKSRAHLHNGILCSRKKEGAAALHCSMDGTGEHYAEWNKPVSEIQIPYNLTCKWNLINKTNEQAKYNQRHWNEEQTDSNKSGGGEKGKGHQGTCIKEPWTKPNGGRIENGTWGWGGVKCWQENGDNCTWTAIKKRKKCWEDFIIYCMNLYLAICVWYWLCTYITYHFNYAKFKLNFIRN